MPDQISRNLREKKTSVDLLIKQFIERGKEIREGNKRFETLFCRRENTKKRVNKATNAYGDDRCQGNDETKEVVWATCHLT